MPVSRDDDSMRPVIVSSTVGAKNIYLCSTLYVIIQTIYLPNVTACLTRMYDGFTNLYYLVQCHSEAHVRQYLLS